MKTIQHQPAKTWYSFEQIRRNRRTQEETPPQKTKMTPKNIQPKDTPLPMNPTTRRRKSSEMSRAAPHYRPRRRIRLACARMLSIAYAQGRADEVLTAVGGDSEAPYADEEPMVPRATTPSIQMEHVRILVDEETKSSYLSVEDAPEREEEPSTSRDNLREPGRRPTRTCRALSKLRDNSEPAATMRKTK